MKYANIVLAAYFICSGLFLYTFHNDTYIYASKYSAAFDLLHLPTQPLIVYLYAYTANCILLIATGIATLIGLSKLYKILSLISTLLICATIDNPLTADPDNRMRRIIYCHVHLAILVIMLSMHEESKPKEKNN